MALAYPLFVYVSLRAGFAFAFLDFSPGLNSYFLRILGLVFWLGLVGLGGSFLSGRFSLVVSIDFHSISRVARANDQAQNRFIF